MLAEIDLAHAADLLSVIALTSCSSFARLGCGWWLSEIITTYIICDICI